MQYINGLAPQGTFVNEINEEVTKVKENKEMEKSYMTYAMEIERRERIARNIGLEEGIKQGVQKEQIRFILALLEKHVSLETIVAASDLSAETIKAIAHRNGMDI